MDSLPGQPAYADDADRWHAVCANDVGANAYFVYGVATTGIYCRPGCASRRPNRANVAFYTSAEEAEAAGYRPCKRCRPSYTGPDRDRQRVARAARQIEACHEMPVLAELASQAHLSPYHFQRLFKRVAGITPRQYAMAVRDERLRRSLQNGTPVTRAMMDTGFQSSGHFHAAANQALGMPARRYRDGGEGMTIRFALGESALGTLLVAGTERGVCAVELGDDAETLLAAFQARFPRAKLVGDDADYAAHVARLAGFVAEPTALPDLPLDIRGTVFQQRVWQALREIPPGETTSYSALAARIGAPRATRAVAGACAANRLALVIPCHRVVRSDGALGGYRWHVERKRALLDREAQAVKTRREARLEGR